MSEIDFVTALGRLLHDAQLREAFREDRARAVEKLNVRATDRESLERLAPDEVEFQARLLLRKRLQTIQRCLPIMCQRLGDRLWPTFIDYSSKESSEADPASDACRFAECVARAVPGARCSSEINRLRFVTGRARFSLRFTRDAGASMPGGNALQIFIRWRDSKWTEWTLGIRSYPRSMASKAFQRSGDGV